MRESRSPFYLLFAFAGVGALLGCVAPGPYVANGTSVTQRAPGVDYCAERLPVAQANIEELYTKIGQSSRRDEIRTEIRGPGGKMLSLSVSSDESGTILLDSVETGLADMVLNCGASFSDKQCFVDIYLDGVQLADLGPTDSGRVPFRCLTSGRHELRIESVGEVLFEGVIDLKSDHEHLVEIREGSGFQIYAVNPIQGRVPAIPTAQNTVATNTGGAMAVGVSDGETSVGATVSSGDARAPGVSVSSKTSTRDSSTHSTTSDSTRYGRRHGASTHTTTTDSTRDSSTSTRSSVTIGATPGRVGVGTSTTTTTTTQAPPEHMSPRAFGQLVRTIQGESFDKTKLGMVQMAARTNLFTSSQVKRLVGLMSFSKSQVEVGVLCYDRVVDPENYTQVLSVYKFSGDKRKVMKRLGM